MKLNLSLGQMDITLGDVNANIARARTLAVEAARRGSQLLLLPELWSTGYDLGNAGRDATGTDGGGFGAMRAFAQEYRLHLVGSCLSRLPTGKLANTAILAGPDGNVVGEYSKVHLFRGLDENVHLASGKQISAPRTPWGPVGLTVCYDLRFPEMFRAYALAGCRLIAVVAEWPSLRVEHWQTLLRARAIENQLYIAACNSICRISDTTCAGHSCIIDPWGETVVEAGAGELLLSAEIDLDYVDQVRARMPIFEDRKPDVYARLLLTKRIKNACEPETVSGT